MPLPALLQENLTGVKLSIGLEGELAKLRDYPHQNKKLSPYPEFDWGYHELPVPAALARPPSEHLSFLG